MGAAISVEVCARPTVRCWRSTASPSRSPRARSSGCWAPTARASPPASSASRVAPGRRRPRPPCSGPTRGCTATSSAGRIGSQLQESALPDRIKVWEALRLFASLAPGAVDWAALVERWGLAAKRNATFASLSGGQRQRLSVTLALVNQPEVVFVDEMTTGLDPAARRETWGLIEAIRDQGTTVVLVTHFMDEAERLCDRLAVIKAGHLVALDTPRGLVAGQAGGTRVSFSVDAEDVSWLERVPHVHRVRRRGLLVEVDGAGPVVAHLGHALVEHGVDPGDLQVHQPTLEDVYLRLTGPDGPEGGSGADAGRDDLG